MGLDIGIELLTLIMFGSLLALLMAGLPLAFVTGGLACVFLFLLGDASSDTEEFDDHVVLHEWSHYF